MSIKLNFAVNKMLDLRGLSHSQEEFYPVKSDNLKKTEDAFKFRRAEQEKAKLLSFLKFHIKSIIKV